MAVIMTEGVTSSLHGKCDGLKTCFSPVPHSFDSTWIPESGGQIF